MLYTIELSEHYKGVHVANDPHGRGFAVILNFSDADAADLAMRSLTALPALTGDQADETVDPLPDPMNAIDINPVTLEVVHTPPGMEYLVGLNMKKRADNKWEPADWDEYDRRRKLAEQPAAGALEATALNDAPANMDASTQAFVDDLLKNRGGTPADSPTLPVTDPNWPTDQAKPDIKADLQKMRDEIVAATGGRVLPKLPPADVGKYLEPEA